MPKKTSAELDREIAEFLAQSKTKGSEIAALIMKRDATRAREINAILRAADGRNVYLIRQRLGDETVHRVSQARTRGRMLEVRNLATGEWKSVWPERGDKLEIR